MTDRMAQTAELKGLWDITTPDTRKWFHAGPHRQASRPSGFGPSYKLHNGYELRTTPHSDGGPSKLEIHLDIWENGIWQEVPSKEMADRFTARALRENEPKKKFLS